MIATGSVHVTVKYRVMLLRPFRNEVLDAIVTMASDESGFFAAVGPLQIFVSRHNMPDDIGFDESTGWLCTLDIRVILLKLP